METKDMQSTRVTFRIPYRAKRELMVVAKEIGVLVGKTNPNISWMIRTALEYTWGVKCDEYGPGPHD